MNVKGFLALLLAVVIVFPTQILGAMAEEADPDNLQIARVEEYYGEEPDLYDFGEYGEEERPPEEIDVELPKELTEQFAELGIETKASKAVQRYDINYWTTKFTLTLSSPELEKRELTAYRHTYDTAVFSLYFMGKNTMVLMHPEEIQIFNLKNSFEPFVTLKTPQDIFGDYGDWSKNVIYVPEHGYIVEDGRTYAFYDLSGNLRDRYNLQEYSRNTKPFSGEGFKTKSITQVAENFLRVEVVNSEMKSSDEKARTYILETDTSGAVIKFWLQSNAIVTGTSTDNKVRLHLYRLEYPKDKSIENTDITSFSSGKKYLAVYETEDGASGFTFEDVANTYGYTDVLPMIYRLNYVDEEDRVPEEPGFREILDGKSTFFQEKQKVYYDFPNFGVRLVFDFVGGTINFVTAYETYYKNIVPDEYLKIGAEKKYGEWIVFMGYLYDPVTGEENANTNRAYGFNIVDKTIDDFGMLNHDEYMFIGNYYNETKRYVTIYRGDLRKMIFYDLEERQAKPFPLDLTDEMQEKHPVTDILHNQETGYRVANSLSLDYSNKTSTVNFKTYNKEGEMVGETTANIPSVGIEYIMFMEDALVINADNGFVAYDLFGKGEIIDYDFSAAIKLNLNDFLKFVDTEKQRPKHYGQQALQICLENKEAEKYIPQVLERINKAGAGKHYYESTTKTLINVGTNSTINLSWKGVIQSPWLYRDELNIDSYAGMADNSGNTLIMVKIGNQLLGITYNKVDGKGLEMSRFPIHHDSSLFKDFEVSLESDFTCYSNSKEDKLVSKDGKIYMQDKAGKNIAEIYIKGDKIIMKKP